MDEPASRLLGRDRLQRPPDRLDERLLLRRARPLPPKERLELAERLLDRRDLRRVGGQEKHLAEREPLPSTISPTLSPLWVPREGLSITSVFCPGESDGARTRST